MTRARAPPFTTSRPRFFSANSASRTVERPTPNRSIKSRSDGSFVPAGVSPDNTISSMCSAISCSEAWDGRMRRSSEWS